MNAERDPQEHVAEVYALAAAALGDAAKNKSHEAVLQAAFELACAEADPLPRLPS